MKKDFCGKTQGGNVGVKYGDETPAPRGNNLMNHFQPDSMLSSFELNVTTIEWFGQTGPGDCSVAWSK